LKLAEAAKIAQEAEEAAIYKAEEEAQAVRI